MPCGSQDAACACAHVALYTEPQGLHGPASDERPQQSIHREAVTLPNCKPNTAVPHVVQVPYPRTNRLDLPFLKSVTHLLLYDIMPLPQLLPRVPVWAMNLPNLMCNHEGQGLTSLQSSIPTFLATLHSRWDAEDEHVVVGDCEVLRLKNRVCGLRGHMHFGENFCGEHLLDSARHECGQAGSGRTGR